jgi:hypothetical protein
VSSNNPNALPPTLSVAEAAKLLGIRRLLVPRAKLLELLGEERAA